ncbi:hypothetical protein M231_04257 [Tremella mesenterica]|uniref:Uncharacterized protein n=1 Tax=Tremella mesenterica TaxID=5217 RepID=A0A4Q1BL31_TREME|nr:hypothetical protein M231_04257 [Tremella mesenterica]
MPNIRNTESPLETISTVMFRVRGEQECTRRRTEKQLIIMSEPKRIQPTYFGPNDESESFTKGLKSFWKDQIVAPQYYDDNLK